MKNDEKYLSVVVCAYNEEEYLKRCLEALFSQTYSYDKYEVIIVDDESFDATSQIITDFIQTHQDTPGPLLTYKRIDHAGLSVARNTGIKLSKGDVIAFIDGDAVAFPDWVENIVREFNKSDSLRIIGGPVHLLNDDSKFADFIFNSFQSLEMKPPVAVIGTNMAFSKSLFDNDTYFHPAFISRGDESYVFEKMRSKYSVIPEQLETIVVKHETPASLKAWLKTRYQVGLFSAMIDRLLNRKYSPETLKKMFQKACSISLFVFVVIILLLSIKNPYILILLIFPAYLFYRRYIKVTHSYLKEYQRNTKGQVRLKGKILLIFSCIVNIFLADYGYIKEYIKQ